MGNTWVREFHEGPEVTPRQDSVPTFDPMLGFPNGRKPRVMTVTAEVSKTIQKIQWHRATYSGLSNRKREKHLYTTSTPNSACL